MDELGRLGGGPGAEVVSLHQPGPQPSGCRIEGDAGARDATADDEDVERHASQAFEGGGAVEGQPVTRWPAGGVTVAS